MFIGVDVQVMVLSGGGDVGFVVVRGCCVSGDEVRLGLWVVRSLWC